MASALDRYYRELERIELALKRRQYADLINFCYSALPLVPGMIAGWKREMGTFDITSIPCIELAARFSSAQGDVERLRELRTWVASIPELRPWLVDIDDRITAASVVGSILELAAAQPGHLQSALPKTLGVAGRLTGRLVADMEKLGTIARVPSGKSYGLYLPEAAPTVEQVVVAPPKRARVQTVVDNSSDTWIAIDFETATSERYSACSLGVAVIHEGVITGAGSWLIQPPENRYDPRNVQVHGIHPSMTAAAPTYLELYSTLRTYLEGRFVIAHWADFDISVLRATHQYYGLPLPTAQFTCSCRMSQRAFPQLRNHKLPTVCGHCSIPLDHHDAASDATACALVALHCRDAIRAQSVSEAVSALGIKIGSV